jgi:hypothetical protein
MVCLVPADCSQRAEPPLPDTWPHHGAAATRDPRSFAKRPEPRSVVAEHVSALSLGAAGVAILRVQQRRRRRIRLSILITREKKRTGGVREGGAIEWITPVAKSVVFLPFHRWQDSPGSTLLLLPAFVEESGESVFPALLPTA